jgi:hypothetical protein
MGNSIYFVGCNALVRGLGKSMGSGLMGKATKGNIIGLKLIASAATNSTPTTPPSMGKVGVAKNVHASARESIQGERMKILVAKTLSGLRPIDEQGEAVFRRWGLGEIVTVEVKKPRNLKFHAKFFAMLNIILKNQTHYKSVDDLLDVCKLRTGHCRTVATKFGDVQIPESISFAAMDDGSFADFYDRACFWVISEVIPGLDRAGLDEAVREQLQGFGRPEG